MEYTGQESRIVEWSQWSDKADHSGKLLFERSLRCRWHVRWPMYLLQYRCKYLLFCAECMSYVKQYVNPCYN